MKYTMPIGVAALLSATVTLLAGCGDARTREAAYLQHGREYFAAANYDKARVEFRNAAQIDPKDAEALYLLGQVAEHVGDVRAAVGYYQSAITENSRLAKARAALGRVYLYAGLPDKAMELVEPGLQNEPNNAQLLTVRAAVRQQLGDAAGAFTDAQRAVQLAPDDDYAVAFLASVYKQQGRLDQAIAVVRSAATRLPKNVDLRTILADLLISSGQLAGGEAQLREVIVLEPAVVAHRYRLAHYYVTQKNIDAAERTLRDAVAAVPDSSDAKTQLLEFLAAQRGRDAVAAEADRLVAGQADNDALKLAIGQVLAQVGLGDRAENLFRAVIGHAVDKPEGLTARDRLAALRLEHHDEAGAEQLIAQVLKANARDNDALVLRANMALAGGRAQAAIVDLRAVLRDQPNSIPLLRALARAYVQNNEADQAEETLRGAVQLSPKDQDARLELAQVLANAGKLDQAGPLLTQLVQENPSGLAIQEALFRVQAAQQHLQEARATAVNIQKSHPDVALGYYLAGLVDEASSQDAAAEQEYAHALAVQPAVSEPLAALVKVRMRHHENDQAVAAIETAIAANPGNGAARNLKAEMLLLQGKTDAAIAAYRDVEQVAPAWPEGYRGMAQAQIVARNDAAAIQTLQQGIARVQDPRSLVVDLALVYERLHRVDDAIALYDGLLAKNPAATFAANNLAMLLVNYRSDAASLARARQLADQLASLSAVDAMDTRGWVKFKSGDFHGAESLLQQAVDKSPDAPELRYHLAMAQLRAGEQQPAVQNLEAALRSARAFSGMDDARSTLAQLKKQAASG